MKDEWPSGEIAVLVVEEEEEDGELKCACDLLCCCRLSSSGYQAQ